ncbi:ABC transporter-like protein [Salinarchaeum sp. Harcht-Bsk1]|uniref:ABC transporter ATP-binding protein n=1 Tax=Salinarchaeum sp. Harcht-Bsk1 TaxID=1333523 RepID=UPI00034248A3|nr:ABC transporter ATP-binding protein [Salinarchaeum sp. Harcht-Bsk1]AGN02143.1 ABC transporter-like protein [Salinarchaeum sp. Harcht-Bsk1]
MATAEDDSVFERYRDQVDRPLSRLFREYGLPEIRWFSIGMVANVIARSASLLPPLVLGVAIDAVFVGDGQYSLPFLPQAWVPTSQSGQFWFSAALIVGAFVATGVFTWVYGVAANVFAHRVMHEVRTDTFARMQRLDMPFFDDKQTGEVMSVLNNDASNLEVFLDNALQNSARLGVMLLGIAALLFYLNPQLALVTLTVIPVMIAFTLWFMRAVEPRYVAQRSSVGDLNTRLENSLSGIELVKASATEDRETEKVTNASYDYFQHTMSVLKLNYLYRPGMELLAGIAFAATFVVGGIWLFSGPPAPFSGSLSVGEFVTFVFLTQRIVTPLAEVSNIVDQYENAKASSERVFGLMDVPVRIEDPEDPVVLDDPAGRVEYDDVDFAYPESALAAAEGTETAAAADGPGDGSEIDAEEAPERTADDAGRTTDDLVLEGIDFAAEPGETVALVGPTGAGKSTVCKLLLRLYDVTDGSIRVDGHDVRACTLDSLRESIGYVSQDVVLFDGTVAENVRYGRFDASREDVVEAAKMAEAHEFIENLPRGYDTRIGEDGVKLSGGQRQRLSIARTVLRDPDILVLDEATSAVDTETELLIQRSLDRLAVDRTTFVIAHRLSTIREADTILVLEGGQIVERGTHEELIDRDGLYASLWGVQAGEIESLPEAFLEEARERAAERPPADRSTRGDDD